LSGVFPAIHNYLHAHRPVAQVMAFRQAKVGIQLLADGTDRAVTDDRECGADVHARREAIGGIAFFVHALVEQRTPTTFGFVAADVRRRFCGALSEVRLLKSAATSPFSISTCDTGVPGQIWTVPILCTCAQPIA